MFLKFTFPTIRKAPKAFSFYAFSENKPNFPYSIPYNFSKTFFEPDHKVSEDLSVFLKVFNPDIQKGFCFAFNNVLDAIQSEDLNFLQKNFEKRFFRKIEKFPDNLKENNLKIELLNEGDDKMKFFPLAFDINFGVYLERDSNPKNLIQSNFGFKKNSNSPINTFFYRSSKSMIGLNHLDEIKLVVQAHVVFETRKKLILLKKQEHRKEIEENLECEYHKVMFECETEDLKEKLTFKTVFEMLKHNEGENPMEKTGTFFRKFTYATESRWKISDIDDFMQGNPF